MVSLPVLDVQTLLNFAPELVRLVSRTTAAQGGEFQRSVTIPGMFNSIYYRWRAEWKVRKVIHLPSALDQLPAAVVLPVSTHSEVKLWNRKTLGLKIVKGSER
jgi:hypothetical protein